MNLNVQIFLIIMLLINCEVCAIGKRSENRKFTLRIKYKMLMQLFL